MLRGVDHRTVIRNGAEMRLLSGGLQCFMWFTNLMKIRPTDKSRNFLSPDKVKGLISVLDVQLNYHTNLYKHT